MPWSSEFAQFPTPTIATRTLPSSRRALPLVVATGSSGKLLANVQDALDDREPGSHREHENRPRQASPRREHESGSDEYDTLGARAKPDIALQSERLGAGARVRDEERADDCRNGEHDGPVLPVTREDERDCSEHRTLAYAVGGGVDERAERSRLAAHAGECTVEDVEQRAHDEDEGCEPVDEQRVGAVLERHEDRRQETQRDACRREDVRRDAGARQ